MGCYEISLGDTIGVGHPGNIGNKIGIALFSVACWSMLPVHFFVYLFLGFFACVPPQNRFHP
jgi:hypothetical protein